MGGEYVQPSQKQLEDPAPSLIFKDLDSRLRLLEARADLTEEQKDIEMERKKFLSNAIVQSPFGGFASQTISTFEDWIVFMTETGIYSVQHMTWQEYVETSEQDMDNTWIDTLQKTRDIFDGKIKGFKG